MVLPVLRMNHLAMESLKFRDFEGVKVGRETDFIIR
jgi:hypothetical protein